MLRTTSCLLIILQVVTADLPLHCGRPPPGVNPAECCDFPPIFKKEDFEGCGIEKVTNKDDDFKPPPPPDCSKQICLLKKYNIMKDDTKIDTSALQKFMDNWAETNPDFKDAVEIAKERCIKENLPRPPHICEPTAIVFCISNTMFMECPKWKETDNCKKVKDHLDACKSHISKQN